MMLLMQPICLDLRIRSVLVVTLAVLAAAPTPARAEEDAELIRVAFSQYKAAILARQGEKATALLSQSTYDYYDEMRSLALYGAEESVRRQSLVNQMQVLLFRLRVPTDELESLSPEGLISYAVEQGWIGRNSVARIEPGTVEIEGDVAVVSAVVGDRDAGPAFRFERESRGWRLDLVATTQAGNEALRLAAQRQGMTEGDFLAVLMKSLLGKELEADAWKPPKPSAKPEP